MSEQATPRKQKPARITLSEASKSWSDFQPKATQLAGPSIEKKSTGESSFAPLKAKASFHRVSSHRRDWKSRPSRFAEP